jgi:hypothetical protein
MITKFARLEFELFTKPSSLKEEKVYTRRMGSSMLQKGGFLENEKQDVKRT